MRHVAIGRTHLALLLLALFVTGGSGCTRTRLTRVARFEPALASDAIYKSAPRSAEYKVKYAVAGGDGLKGVGGTKRIVRRGDALGFTTTPEGTVIAVAGQEQFPLDKMPASARYCVWVSREERPTQFTREVGKVAAVAATGVLVGAVGVGAIATGANAAALENYEPDEDDEDCEKKPRRRGRGYRWVGADGKPVPSTSGASGSDPNGGTKR